MKSLLTKDNRINSSEISVVVQGAITDEQSKSYTRQSLESIRKYLPKAELILSTWKNSDVNGLDFDILVESEDPREFFNSLIGKNTNRQIVSTYNGLIKASRKYTLKIRNDIILYSIDFLDYYTKFNERAENWSFLSHRVLNCSVYARKPRRTKAEFNFIHHPSDWFFFGLKEDLISIWDVPLLEDNEMNLEAPISKLMAEQYIWLNLINKFKKIKINNKSNLSIEEIENSEKIFANNLILLEPDQIKLKSLKFANKNQILEPESLYTYWQWLSIYEKYSHGKLSVFLKIKSVYFNFISEFYYYLLLIRHRLKCFKVNQRQHQVLKHKITKKNIAEFKKTYIGKKIYFYGAGQFAQKLLQEPDFDKMDILGIFDKNEESHYKKLNEKYLIYPLEKMKELNPDVIVISTIETKNINFFLNKLKEQENFNYEIISDLVFVK